MKVRCKGQTKKVMVNAAGACFQIEIAAKITNSGTLSTEEMSKLQDKLKHIFTMQIPKLPYAHLYPFQVNVK